ncbi:hypothetical protein KQI68_10035 [Peptoniphilus sp. MSJ-1]|uniref:ABC transmembrane type-1 domain-containing protein n=1 Tax=Peptoniphilus ovalis TaxID=2841503 RepID=A0ABS6FJ41_9FIRM|nr:hypothetical protein [Peptoniphilus ovalis]MBU5670169.1 hypothetical protein [Peptoniphilus ovalis]
MVNSVTLRFFIKAHDLSLELYEDSFTKKIFDAIKRPITIAIENSKVHEFLNNEKPIFKGSFIYKIYSKLFKLIEKLMGFLRKVLVPQIDKSILLSQTFNSLDNFDEVMGIISNIIFYCGLVTTIISLIVRESFVIPLFIMIFGLIASIFKGYYLKIIKDSKVLEFFLSFFDLDKGGEEWW